MTDAASANPDSHHTYQCFGVWVKFDHDFYVVICKRSGKGGGIFLKYKNLGCEALKEVIHFFSHHNF